MKHFPQLYVLLLCITWHVHTTTNRALKFPPYNTTWENRNNAFFNTKFLSNTEEVKYWLTKTNYLTYDIAIKKNPNMWIALLQRVKLDSLLSAFLNCKIKKTTPLSYTFKLSGDFTGFETPFTETTFLTPDNKKLECLVRHVKDAPFTIIIAAGFLPGIMTGMATLIKMLPVNCNIIFYNARGKGKSEGSFSYHALRNYGLHEYQDVIGALNHAKKLDPNTPIILYGICGGAFHTINAVTKMNGKTLKNYNICHIICDSLVSKIQSNVENIPHYIFGSSFAGHIKQLPLWFLRATFFRKSFMAPEEKTTLDLTGLADLGISTTYFHAKYDQISKYDEAKKAIDSHMNKLAQNNKKHLCKLHIFDYAEGKKKDKKVRHALLHIFCKKAYATQLQAAIKNSVEQFYIRKTKKNN